MIDTNILFKELEALAAITERSGIMPKKEISLLKDSDLLSIILPGGELDFTAGNTAGLLDLLKQVGRSNGAIGRIYEGHVNTLYLIHLYGTKEQQEFWYGQVSNQRKLFGVWNTDGQPGISFAVNEDSVTISGSKGFCSGADLVDFALIGGKTDQPGENSDWQMVIVPMELVEEERIDRNSWKPLGMKASVSYTIDFSGIEISRNDMLGMPGEYLKQPYFLGGAIRFAAVQLGMAEAIYNHTLSFLRKLNRLDDPFQKMRIGKMAMSIHGSQLWIRQAGLNFDLWKESPESFEQLVAYANMTRLTIEECGLQVLQASALCVGAKGLMAPGDLERWHRDLSYYLRQPAPDATLQNAAKYLTQVEQPIQDCLLPNESYLTETLL